MSAAIHGAETMVQCSRNDSDRMIIINNENECDSCCFELYS